ncbi:MAG: phospholipase A [Colwellia sp.]|nr:phospholipase A [Colwellia sp.]MCW8865937.1 phospholipase A [Colwellia sp.]MCW9081829.1 phospholipase A [Colwellia sp.]
MKRTIKLSGYTHWVGVCLTAISMTALASDDEMHACLIEKLNSTNVDKNIDKTVRELKQECSDFLQVTIANKPNKLASFFEQNQQQKNIALEPYALTPYVMSPHRMNYLLPISYSDNVNRDAYTVSEGWADNLKDIEIKYQLSFRVPLLTSSLFTEGDGIAFAFTLQSWWQIYAHRISRPFRETNYQPEIFYYTPLDWQPAGGNTALLVGFEHQSNGRTFPLSKSWNRIYANFIFAKDDYAISFRPWWRIPEGDKVTSATEPGDDNPDITDYMGHFELSMVYNWQEYDLFFKGRENFKEHHGAIELGFTFPIYERLKGYVQYTNGYGESLIDYNHSQQTIGIGVSLTDFFKD